MLTKKLIKEKGFTVKQVADAIDKNYPGLNNALNNNSLSLTALKAIADFIGCRIGDFFADECSTRSSSTLTCPHCGKPIHINVEK